MNSLTIICFDFETCSKIRRVNGHLDASTVEPVSVAAVPIDPVTMDISKYGGVFDSLMCPEGDWKTRIDPGALMVNKLNPEDVAKAPPRRQVWEAFADWCSQFNPKGKGKVLTNPIPAGKNIIWFDMPIAEWLSKKYGTCDSEGVQKIFHRRPGSQWGIFLDLEHDLWRWFEGPRGDLDKINMDDVRKYFGLETDNGHEALFDCYQTAEMICRFMRLHRKIFEKMINDGTPFRNSMRNYKVPRHAKTQGANRPEGVGPRGDQLQPPVLLQADGTPAGNGV